MLLEMLIAMGLTAVLLTLLFRFLVSNANFERKVDLAAAAVMERQRVVERLETVLTQSEVFYTALFPDDSIAESVVISFNAGIDPNPEFSSTLIGRIYVTEAGELTLGSWTASKKQYRTEVLLKNIRELEWQFLGPKMAWLKEWPKKQGGVPEIIRLKLWCGESKKQGREPSLQFAFILPHLTPLKVK